MNTAKVFWSGRSQAVRLPKEYRFDVDELRIRRRGSAVILEPLARNWEWLDAVAGTLDPDFADAAQAQPDPEKRPALDNLFA